MAFAGAHQTALDVVSADGTGDSFGRPHADALVVLATTRHFRVRIVGRCLHLWLLPPIDLVRIVGVPVFHKWFACADEATGVLSVFQPFIGSVTGCHTWSASSTSTADPAAAASAPYRLQVTVLANG